MASGLCLAATALALTLFGSAEPAQAHEVHAECDSVVWASKLTVGVAGATRGYHDREQFAFGSLAPDTFTHGGATFTVEKLAVFRGGGREGLQTLVDFGSVAWAQRYALYFDGVRAVETLAPVGGATAGRIFGRSGSEQSIEADFLALNQGSALVLPTWNAGDVVDVELRVVDRCHAVTVTPSSVTVSEGGTETTDTFDVVLNAQPTADVTVSLGSSDTAAVTIDGAAQSTQVKTLTFTTGNWNMAQTVTVTAVNDSVDDPWNPRTAAIQMTSASSDADYHMSTSRDAVTVTVNDEHIPPRPFSFDFVTGLCRLTPLLVDGTYNGSWDDDDCISARPSRQEARFYWFTLPSGKSEVTFKLAGGSGSRLYLWPLSAERFGWVGTGSTEMRARHLSSGVHFLEVASGAAASSGSFQLTMEGLADPPVDQPADPPIMVEPPGVPAPRIATTTTTSLTVTWPSPANAGPAITGYNVQYREGASGDFTAWPHAGTGRTATITGLTAGRSYEVQVQAVNDDGRSDWSASVTGATTRPTGPTGPTSPTGPTGGDGGGGGGGGAAPPLRLSGSDRYETAAAVGSRLVGLLEAPGASGAREQVDTVIVASGQSFPDALAASALSRTLRAPVLLTSRDRLEPAVRSFIVRHRIAKVVIVGGPAAVSETVDDALEAMDEVTSVVRYFGADRYATAARIAAVVGEPGVHCGTFDRAVIVTTGQGFADALVAGPLAYRGQHPILLTDPDRLPEPTRSYLDDTTATLAIVIGGEGAVSAEVARQIEALGLSVRRINGDDRAHTSARVARYLTVGSGGAGGCFRNDIVGLATGWAFPDALAAASLLGHYGAPLLLTSPDGLPQPLLDYAADGLLDRDVDLPPIVTIGGTTAVPSRHPNQILANTPR